MMLGMMGANAAAGGGAATDPYIASVKALLRFEGADGSTTFTNSVGPMTFSATSSGAVVSTARPKFGTGSLLNPDANGYVQSTGGFSPFAGRDFTIDAWVYPTTSTPSWQVFFGSDFNVGMQGADLWLGDNSLNTWATGPAVTLNTWSQVTVTRVGTTMKVYLNGVLAITYNSAPASLTGGTIMVANRTASFGIVNGNLDEFRLTDGVARDPTTYNLTSQWPDS